MLYVRPFIPLLVVMMCGIGMGVYIQPGIFWIFLVMMTASGFMFCRIYCNQMSAIAPLVLFFCIGLFSIIPFITPDFPAHHIIHYTDMKRFTITGCVASPPIQKNRRWRFVLKTEFIQEPHRKKIPVCGNIRVTARTLDGRLQKGDRISFFSKIRSIRNFNNPGRFDYKRYMAFQNIWGSSYIWDKEIHVVKKNENRHFVAYWLDANRNFRFEIATFIRAIDVSTETQSILQALLIGKRDLIAPALRDVFNRAGVGHLLAISGLHVGMVTTTALFLFTRLFAFVKPLLWNGWSHRCAAFFSLFPAWAYGWLAGFSPSTQRAEIMISLWLLSFFVQRQKDAINCLAIAAFIILIVSPPSLFSISFQLSFTAVLTILLGTSCFSFPTVRDTSLFKKFWNIILGSCFVSGLAILGTLPLTMYYFNQIAWVGVLSNLLMIPLVGILVLPMGLLAVVLYPFSMAGSHIAMYVAGHTMEVALQIIYFFAGIPGVAVKTFTPTFPEMIAYYVLLATLLFLFKRRAHSHSVYSFLKNRWYQLTLIAVILFFIGDMVFWWQQRFQHDDLKITIIDVGQGNAALVEFPEGTCMLIDGGGFSDQSVFDVGENILASFLLRKKILTVDTVVLTHPDCDHLNGLLYIMQHFHVKSVWSNHQAADSLGYRKFINIISEKKSTWPLYKNLKRHISYGEANLEILYPPVDYLDKMKHEKWRNTNNNSLVLKVSLHNFSILFPGDIMKKGERELALKMGKALKSDVLIAPHHGSKSSSTSLFLQKVDPLVVIVSCGWMNRFHFPHGTVLQRYQRNGYDCFRTDTYGAVTLKTDGYQLEISSFGNGKENRRNSRLDLKNDSILTRK